VYHIEHLLYKGTEMFLLTHSLFQESDLRIYRFIIILSLFTIILKYFSGNSLQEVFEILDSMCPRQLDETVVKALKKIVTL